jgi:uncharacterized membrane protein YeaQ/YmgE (transglycosylase-associated protein family)
MSYKHAKVQEGSRPCLLGRVPRTLCCHGATQIGGQREDTSMGIIGWIIFGLIVGAVAKLLMPGRDPGGWIVTILLGIAGALVGGFLGRAAGWYGPNDAAGFLMSLVGRWWCWACIGSPSVGPPKRHGPRWALDMGRALRGMRSGNDGCVVRCRATMDIGGLREQG